MCGAQTGFLHFLAKLGVISPPARWGVNDWVGEALKPSTASSSSSSLQRLKTVGEVWAGGH